VKDPRLEETCSSGDVNDPEEDFCSGSPMKSYLRVYSMMIEDYALSDFQETSSVTFLWFMVTFFGLVVMMNTLIAGEFLGEKSHIHLAFFLLLTYTSLSLFSDQQILRKLT
jgi:hypothetical protein